jgi:hypothetical protein
MKKMTLIKRCCSFAFGLFAIGLLGMTDKSNSFAEEPGTKVTCYTLTFTDLTCMPEDYHCGDCKKHHYIEFKGKSTCTTTDPIPN